MAGSSKSPLTTRFGPSARVCDGFKMPRAAIRTEKPSRKLRDRLWLSASRIFGFTDFLLSNWSASAMSFLFIVDSGVFRWLQGFREIRTVFEKSKNVVLKTAFS